MQETPETPADEKSDPNQITIADLRQLLDDEQPPTNDRDPIGNDKEIAEYSLNSSFSEEEKEEGAGSPSVISPIKFIQAGPDTESHKKRAKIIKEHNDPPQENGTLSDLSIDDVEDVISNPYAEMPEFYQKQIDFEPIAGLPGNQQVQLEHKHKTVLKNKYWDKLLKEVFDMSTSKVARPAYLSKVLSLYLLHQDKLSLKRKEEAKASASCVNESIGAKTTLAINRKTSPMVRRIDTPSFISEKTPGGRSHKASAVVSPLSRFGLTATNASGQQSIANTEMKKRVERLEKVGLKFDMEELAKESKNILVRMEPYKKKEGEMQAFSDRDATFMKMMCDFAIQKGFVKAWKEAKA